MFDANARLLVRLKHLGGSPRRGRVTLIRISRLPAAVKTRDNLSRALMELGGLKARHKGGEIFLMKDLDVVFLSGPVPRDELERTCDAMRQIFVGQSSAAAENFHTIYDLETQFDDVVRWAEDVAGVAAAPAQQTEARPKEAATPALLARLTDEIERMDISTLIFNQTVHKVTDTGRAAPLFHEMYISVKALEDRLCPGTSLTKNRWLFASLSEALDAAMLRALANPTNWPVRRRVSININISSLGSPIFARFDSEVDPSLRQEIIFEINKTDLFENMRLYAELAPFMKERGYRVAIDGLSFLSFGAIDFKGVICDYAKVMWSAELKALADDNLERITKKMAATARPQLILAHCDAAESVRFARKAKIPLVQGRLVDHMVRKQVPI